MMFSNYGRRTLKGLWLLAGCCMLYFLSTGPAMLLLINTKSDSTEKGVVIYLTPVMEIEHLLSGLSCNDPFTERTLLYKGLVMYLELYGDKVADCYQVMFWQQSILSGHFRPTGSCVF